MIDDDYYGMSSLDELVPPRFRRDSSVFKLVLDAKTTEFMHMKKPKKEKVIAKGVTFEKIMVQLRRGKKVRRQAWVSASSHIVRAGDRVVLFMYDQLAQLPQPWQPYATDILASDWVVLT